MNNQKATNLNSTPNSLFVSQIIYLSHYKDGKEYSVSELHSVDAELTKLSMEDPHSNATNTCSYHSKGGFGHATTGVRRGYITGSI